METQVYAFAQIHDEEPRRLVYEEIHRGRSRFGMWDQPGSLREEAYGKHMFLLRIKRGDWIVHVNMPKYGHCVAVQVAGEYEFDDGLPCDWGRDFHNIIPVDPATIVEFDRNDVNVLPSVNLSPLKRAQRVLQVADFLASLENIRTNRHGSSSTELRGLIHLKDRIEGLLPQVTQAIQAMHRSKQFETFLQKVFENMPLVKSVQNGFGWGTDNGADLIVECENPVIRERLRTRLVVQAKSYQGDHYDLSGVDQLVTAIRHYEAHAGVLITTAKSTRELEAHIEKQAEAVGKPIELIAGDDVARFVLRHASKLLIE